MASPTDRIKGSLLALIDTVVGHRIDYHAMYPCTVIVQSPLTNNLELLPDNERMRGFGLAEIPIRTGAPGYKYEVSVGSRVLLGFDAGDPSKPFAALWSEETGVSTVTFDGGSEDISRTNDPIIAGHLIFDANPTAPILYYAPDIGGAAGGGSVPGIYTPVVLTAPTVPPIPGALGTPLGGFITAGNEKLKA